MAKNCSAGKAKRKSDRFSKRIKSAIEKRKAARKLARQKRKARKHVTWTYIQDSYAVVIAWLNGRFDISEHEYLFGVVSFDKVRILEILRAIVLAEFKKGGSIKVNELEQAYREAVKKIYTDECDIDRLAFAKDSCEAIRETFFYRAEEYVKSSINNSSIVYKEEDITELAANQLKKFAKNDLRTGTAEIRNHKRREVVKEILENISSGKKLLIKKLAKAHGISNKTASKYIKQINFMLINGIEFQEDVFNEKKRGPKENPYLRISKEAGESLFHAIDNTTPQEHGLEETVWSAKAAHDFLLKYFNKDIDIQYLYYFLHRHDYRSKSASRKNPMIDDSEVEEFKRTLKDKFRKSIENNEIIVFLDECHAFQTTRNQGYARKGSKTFYSHKPNNSHCNYSILSIIGFDFEVIFTVKGTVTVG